MTYRADIDGLRAFAVLSVLLYHAFPEFVRGGFIGVDVFFVISGYLISGIILSEVENKKFSFTNFYERRIRRLFPSLIVVIASSLALGWFFLFTNEYEQLGKHAYGGTIFISNFMFLGEVGYFDNAAELKPLLHLWSLSVEEQFYIIWPLLICILWKKQLNVVGVFLCILIASFSINIALSEINQKAAFFLLFGRIWEFVIGGIIAFAHIKNKQFEVFKNTNPVILSHLGIVVLFSSALFINNQLTYPGLWVVAPVIGSVCIIEAGYKSKLSNIIFTNKPAVWVGLISYPLYLWHWPILSYLRILEGEQPSNIKVITALITSFILAWLTYRYIERPIRFGQQTRVKLSALLIFPLLLIAGGIFIKEKNGLKERYTIFNKNNVEQIIKVAEAWENRGYPNPIGLYIDQKHKHRKIGQKEANTVFMIGDSHATQYINTFTRFFNVDNASHEKSIMFHTSADFPEEPTQKILQDEKIDTIVLSYFWSLRFGSDKVDQPSRCCGKGKNGTIGKITIPYKTDMEMMKIKKELIRIIRIYKNAGKRVIIVLDNPFGTEINPQSMISRQNWRIRFKADEKLYLTNAIQRSEPIRSILIEIAKQTSAEIIDPFAYLCRNKICSAFSEGGDLIYKDYDHISAYTQKNAAKFILKVLD